MRKAELLSPSGSWDCVRAAVSNGANAVYLGGQLFNARAYASNFSLEELEKVCDYCHSHQVKVYVTVNTLYKDEEFEQLLPFIDRLYQMGADGVIMQDLGAISLVRKYWPDLPVHASTQLTSNSLADVRELEDLGIATVVMSRELNLDEITEICRNTNVRVETFIHGALCVSYSGQCFMSSVLGKRSGNRGKCAQNCRLNYKLECEGKKVAEGHLLSTKDICTLDVLPEILDSGVDSLKIEGRMKSAEYVAGVTAIYRKYIDMYYEDREHYAVEPRDREILQQLFNRGGFSQGYFRTHSGSDMMCTVHPRNWGVPVGTVVNYRNGQVTVKLNRPLNNGDGIEIWTADEEGTGCYINKPCQQGINVIPLKGSIKPGAPVYQTYDKKLSDHLNNSIGPAYYRNPVSGFIRLHAGQPCELTLTYGQLRTTVSGETVQTAERQPLSEELVREQIGKMGETIFRLEKLKCDMDGDCYLNRSALNALRNEACRQLEELLVNSYHRQSRLPQLVYPQFEAAREQKVSVSVQNQEQFRQALSFPQADQIIFPIGEELKNNITEMSEAAHEAGCRLIVKLPRIWRQENIADFRWQDYEAADGFMITCLGHLNSVRESGKDVFLDHTGNVLNRFSYDFWRQLGCSQIAMSLESSVSEMIESHDSEILAYGYLPLMVTHQCPIGNFAGYKKNHQYCARAHHEDKYELVQGDRVFPLHTDCDNCVCTIYSPLPLQETETAVQLKAGHLRFSFVNETAREIAQIADSFQKGQFESDGYYRKGIE